MLRYETLILARTEITDDEVSTLERFFDKHITDLKGHLSTFDKWGKYRLSYPVNKNDYGVYILSRYELPENIVTNFFKELDSFFKIKCNEFVMRFITIKLKKDAPTTYIKPEPLDSMRLTNVEAFMRENKMEGLLGGVDLGSSEATTTQAEEPVKVGDK